MSLSPAEDLWEHPPIDAFSSERGKREFHRAAKRYLRELADLLDLPGGTYMIRSNPAGPAIAGEVTLHGGWIYAVIGDMATDPGLGILYRLCNGPKDYVGGRNNWWRWQDIGRLQDFAAAIRRIKGE